jgi:hypothetical protein
MNGGMAFGVIQLRFTIGNPMYKSIPLHKAKTMPYFKVEIDFSELRKSLEHRKFNEGIND